MAQYTCNAQMAADLLPMLAQRRVSFSLVWPLVDMAIFEASESVVKLIVVEANNLNIVEADYQHTVTGRISDPQPQQIERLPRGTPNGLTIKPCPYRHPPTAVCPHCQDWERKRVPASVGAAPACSMTDTCFDSDPSEVGE